MRELLLKIQRGYFDDERQPLSTDDTIKLKAIKERFQQATYGDWKVYQTDEGLHIGTAHDHPQLKGPSQVVCMSTWVEKPHKRVYMTEDDAAFIAHSKEDIRYLLQQAEKAREYEKTLREIAEINPDEKTAVDASYWALLALGEV